MTAFDGHMWSPTKAEMELFEEWRQNMIQHLINYKNGVQPKWLPAQLEDRFDEKIPLHKMGFRQWHINQFLFQMSSDIEVRRYDDDRMFVFLRESSVPKHLMHIRKMVLGQRDDREGVPRNSGRYVPCKELLTGRRPPPQPNNDRYRSLMSIPTQAPSQSYICVGGGGSSNYNNFGLRDQTNKMSSNGGPSSTMKKELPRLNPWAGVSGSFEDDEEDWDIPSIQPRAKYEPPKITYSAYPKLRTKTPNDPKPRSRNTTDEFDGFELTSGSLLKENDPLPPPTIPTVGIEQRKSPSLASTRVSTVKSTAPSTSGPEQGPSSQNMDTPKSSSPETINELLMLISNPDNAAFRKRTGYLFKKATLKRVLSNPPSSDMDMQIQYGYSIDAIDMDAGLPYSIKARSFGKMVPRTFSFRPKIRFPPYLPADCNNFKDYLRQNGELENYMKSVLTGPLDSEL